MLVNKFLTTIIAAACWTTMATAQTPPAWNEIKGEQLIALQTKGDPVRGEAAFEPCQGCHRKDASGRTSGAYPRLSGQHATVIIKQVTDIGDHALSPYDIADIAVYLQGLPISAENGKGPGTGVATGMKTYENECTDCHGSKGEGDAAKFYPMVAAQHYRYLLRELKFIRDGDRRNANPDMVKRIKAFTDDDLEAMADYMAQLPPPKK
jgi:cytochrome c553